MKNLPFGPFSALRTIVESISSKESVADWGTIPPEFFCVRRTMLDHIGAPSSHCQCNHPTQAKRRLEWISPPFQYCARSWACSSFLLIELLQIISLSPMRALSYSAAQPVVLPSSLGVSREPPVETAAF
jgi:hypothetical protein